MRPRTDALDTNFENQVGVVVDCGDGCSPLAFSGLTGLFNVRFTGSSAASSLLATEGVRSAL
ncbi:hypothetical protein V1293_002314 [Bradyrhizobium sp. AZCC 1693]